MKKIFLILISFFLLATIANATTWVLYRLSSGEVTGISDTNNFALDLRETGKLSVTVNPTITDGVEFRNPSLRRELGYSKIYDAGIVRNATQQEIDTFQIAEANDYAQILVDQAKNYFQNDGKFRRIMKAFASIILDELNRNRTWQRDFKDAVAASTSLTDFQSRVAALQGLPDKSLQDLYDSIRDRISEND